MPLLAQLGAGALGRLRYLARLAAVCGAVLAQAARPAAWSRVTRSVFARQILFTGVEALSFIALIAVLVGVAVVVQLQVRLAELGQSDLFGTVLVIVIVREVAPLLVNFIIIGRSGTAIATELANMRVLGEVAVLDAQGLDPLRYLVMPRALAMMVCVFCLTLFFIAIALASGFLSGLFMNVGGDLLRAYGDTVARALQPGDAYNLLAKTLAPGLLTAVICATEGLSVRGAITEVPQASTRAVVRSTTALFLLCAIVSLLTYV
jgi:phospholipid/cholesterol/gamma-HCH transport system permease protein